jgi:hypothetical protein
MHVVEIGRHDGEWCARAGSGRMIGDQRDRSSLVHEIDQGAPDDSLRPMCDVRRSTAALRSAEYTLERQEVAIVVERFQRRIPSRVIDQFVSRYPA